MRLVLSLLFSFGLTLPALADQPLCAQTKDELDKLAGFSVREKWEETEQHEDDGKPMWLTLKDVDGALTLTLEKKALDSDELVKWISPAKIKVCREGDSHVISFLNGVPKLDNRPFGMWARAAIKVNMKSTIQVETLSKDKIFMSPSGFNMLFEPPKSK